MSVRWKVLMGVWVCVMLVTGLLSPLHADHAAFSATPEAASQPETAGPPLRLVAGTFDPLREAAPGSTVQALHLATYPAEGMGYYLIQFQGPIHAADVEALRMAGADVFDYIPDFAFIVKMDNATRASVEQMAQIRWVGLYQPVYRMASGLLARAVGANKPIDASARSNANGKKGGGLTLHDDGPLTLVVSIFHGEPVTPIVSVIEALGGEVLDQSQTEWQSKLKVTLPSAALADVAMLSGVRWIEPAPQWQLHNDEADNVMGVREVWDTQGLYGAGQTVAVCDTGLDQGSVAPASLHDDFENGSGVSRVTTIYDRVGDGANDVNSGHGTHVAGSVLGNGDLSGATPASHTYPEGAYVGMAPEASLIFQAVENNTTEALSGIPLDLNTLFAQADTGGADLHTNSWGSDVSGQYTTDSEAVDQYMWNHKDFTIFFSAANAGIDANSDGVVDLYSLGSPATAKNCVTVGASENNRPALTSVWGSGTWLVKYPVNPVRDDKVADNIAGLAAFSSRGPALDGRYKPDIVAPGTYIASVRSSQESKGGWGVIDANYMYMGGTSMSTPLTAGAAAIVRQYYTDLQSHTPSAALIKATLVNGATDIYPGQYGTGATQEIPITRPTNVAGWGRVNIQDSIFPTAPRAFRYQDQTPGLDTGESDVYGYQITNSAEPFRVTLAWTDYPGSPTVAGGLVNDLDVTVTGPGGTTYYPNNANQRGASQYLAYDNGYGNNYWYWNAGTRVAVRFTPTQYPAKLQTGLFYLASFAYPKTFNWYVYAGNASGPSSVLASGLSTIRAEGWHAIDFASAGVTLASGDFFLAVEMPDSDLIWFTDDTSPDNRSWDYDGATWTLYSDEDYLFHATMSSPDATTQQDRVNNLVGIDIPSPATGVYTVTVSGYNVPQGPQPYALVASGIFTTVNMPPTLAGLPDLALNPGAARDNAIDLWTYATDDSDTDADLTFTITNSTPISAGVSIDGDRYIDINPTASFTDTFPVVVEVMDTGGLTDTDTFSITFAEIPNTAPTLSGLPDQELGPNQSKDNAIDLWTYASDAEDLDANLTFTITNSPPVSAGVSIDSNRYIDITPTGGFSGTVPVDVQVMDTGGLTDTDTFTINFLETQYVYLPLVVRCYPLVPSLLPISNPDGDGLYTVQWAMPACSTAAPSQYEFEVAINPQFSNADGDTTTATSVNVYTPDPTTYYWRVRAYVNGQWTGWSNVRSVNVGAFSYVFVYNGTGGSLRLEMVGVETASFPNGFEDYWRSVPVGTYTVRAWARCGYRQDTDYYPQAEVWLPYRCQPQALSTLLAPSMAKMPSVDFVFKGSASEMIVP